MNEHDESKLTRRGFLAGAALVGAGVVGAGALAACAPSTPSDSGGAGGGGGTGGDGGDPSGEAGAPSANTQSGWRVQPETPTDAADGGTYDVVVVGHGYAGVTSCRELSEQGFKVALLEVQPESSYAASGNESAALNSRVLDRVTAYNPVPHVDPVEYFDNWMTMIGNQGNPGLVMRYCQNMGDNIDWYYDSLTDEDFATITHTGWPNEGETWEHILPSIGPIKFWPGTFSAYSEECNQSKIQGYNRDKARAAGAEFFFETRGQQIVVEGGTIAGVIATDADDNFIRYNCKAVVVATGGFAYNEEMLNDLMPDIADNMTDDEVWKDAFGGERFPAPEGMQYMGDGIKMAHWAGAHLESLVAGMNSKHIQPPSGMTNLPQAVWVRADGRRFCNEFYPIVEQRGVPNVYMTREPIHCVFDDDFTTYRSYYVPQHGGAEPSEATIQTLRDGMDKAYQKFLGTWVEPEETGEEDPMAAMFAPPEYIADDTLEGLAGQLGLTGDAVTAFVEQIGRYNQYCTAGLDEEFGRYSETLFPVEKGPFYGVSGNPGFGEIMCTCGGIITDAEQNALDKDFNPIPGLYVSGNDCGRRYGIEYITPTPGVSLSMAITLGRECGKSVAKWLGA
jgi:hypothetical protein